MAQTQQLTLANVSALKWTALVLGAVCVQLGCGRAPHPFHAARQMIVDGEYAKGEVEMRKIVEREPRGKFSSRAGLFLFKACVAQDRLDDAKRWGQWTIEHHPRSLEAHKCQYKLAMVTMMEGKPGAARERFEALGDNPSGPLAGEAKAMARFLKSYRIELEAAQAEPQ